MKDFTILGQLLDILANNLNSENEQLKAHAQTLLGPRTRGSATKRPLSAVPKDTPVSILDSPLVSPGCVCYTFQSDKLGGQLGALPLTDIQALGLRRSIRVIDGTHGKELVCCRTMELPKTDKFSVIVGEFAGELAIFTWHPGTPLAPLPQDFAGNYDSLDPMVGVKVICP